MEKSRAVTFSLRSMLVIVFLAAIGIATYRKFYVPPLSEIEGIKILHTRKRGHDIVFDRNATSRTADHLVGQLEEQTSLWFYDSVYDSPSDPGAFVEILFYAGEYWVKLSNHGWSTDWLPVTRDEAVEYLWACRGDNGPDRKNSLLKEGMWLRQDVEPPKKLDRKLTNAALEFIRSRIE